MKEREKAFEVYGKQYEGKYPKCSKYGHKLTDPNFHKNKNKTKTKRRGGRI